MELTPHINEQSICRACGQRPLLLVPGFADLARVTSDCRVWPGAGRLSICPKCHLVQKPEQPSYREECRAIYASYALYHQGEEQRVFDQQHGTSEKRSALIARLVADRAGRPAHGRLLDFGCGDGRFLSAFSRECPGWRLDGSDQSPHYREALSAIPGFREYTHQGLEALQGPYDLITLSHTLEHIFAPGDLLERLARRLAPEGRLFVLVPNHLANPFELVIADHCSHFTPQTLGRLAQAAGLVPDLCADDLVAKEIVMFAHTVAPAVNKPEPLSKPKQDSRGIMQRLKMLIDWLRDFARACAAVPVPRGILGTAVAAAWLFSTLEHQIDFFVDEASAGRAGAFLKRPVYAGRDIPNGAAVLLPFPPSIARQIQARLDRAGLVFVLPEPWSWSDH